MSFKEKFSNEAKDLRSFKKFYETIAFIVLTALVVQQLFFLIWNGIRGFVKNDWFNTNGFTNANLQAYVARIADIDRSSVFVMIVSLIAWILYYVFMYFVVFKFSSKRGMSKWTWTLFVIFGPNVIFAPAYIWFILFAYRYEIYAIFRKVVREVGESGEDSKEDVEVVEAEPIEEVKPVLKPKPAAKPKTTETKTTTKKED
ncbi:MAG: hypothetical protein ACOX4W_02580 [Bacilli bacterium]